MCKKILLDPLVQKVPAAELEDPKKSNVVGGTRNSGNSWDEPYKNCRMQYHIFKEGRKNVTSLLDYLKRRELRKKPEKLKKLKINPCQTYVSYKVHLFYF